MERVLFHFSQYQARTYSIIPLYPKLLAKLITYTRKWIKMVNAFIRWLCVQYFLRHLHSSCCLDWKKTLLHVSTEIVMTITNNIYPRKPPREPVGRYQSLSVEYWNGIIPILPIDASYNLLLRGNSQNDIRSLTNELNFIMVCIDHT